MDPALVLTVPHETPGTARVGFTAHPSLCPSVRGLVSAHQPSSDPFLEPIPRNTLMIGVVLPPGDPHGGLALLEGPLPSQRC